VHTLHLTDTALVFPTLNELEKWCFGRTVFPGAHKTPSANYVMGNMEEGGKGFHNTTNKAPDLWGNKAK